MNKKHKPIVEYIGKRKCSIAGFGVSNLPLAGILSESGIDFDVWDRKSPDELGEDADTYVKSGTSFYIADKDFSGIDGELIFRSPGIRPDIAGFSDAVQRGSILTSEIEAFLELTPASVYALTGSDGKTTSTTLCGMFLSENFARQGSGKAYVGGNIGTPLLEYCDEMSSSDSAVLELSSFQLMTMAGKTSPKYAAITNISPNHLDWHRGMEEYISAKKNIVGTETRRFVTNRESENALELALEFYEEKKSCEDFKIFLFSSSASSYGDIYNGLSICGGYAVYVRDGKIIISDGNDEDEVLDVSRIRLPGIHNIENYMTAISLTYGNVNREVYSSVADEFAGVEHRLEYVCSISGVDYYNSSIDSSPTRTTAALSALSGRDIVVICGGYDKKIPFEPLAESLIEYARAVVLTGATGEKIKSVIEANPRYDKSRLQLEYMSCFKDAVVLASKLGRAGGCVLLSPACASFDAFKNFDERGKYFKKTVYELQAKEN